MPKFITAVLPLLLAPLAALAADTANIDVTVTGLNNDQGTVRIAMFNTESAYKEDDGSGDKAFQRAAVKISGQQATYTFTGVPYGAYAIKLFHDEENSGKFLKGAFGIPKVQYGFSNNVRGRFGPAPFDKARFQVNKPEVKLQITAR